MFDFSFAEIAAFFSADGQRQLMELIETAQRERGAGWIDGLTAEFPALANVFSLVCNFDERAALDKLKNDYPLLRIGTFDAPIIELHRRLREQIDRPRNFPTTTNL